VTQTNLRNIENFKTKATGKKQMMFCIACAKSNIRQHDLCQWCQSNDAENTNLSSLEWKPWSPISSWILLTVGNPMKSKGISW
jgi:hypothetical protein